MTDTMITPEERMMVLAYAKECRDAPCQVLLRPERVFALLSSLEAAEKERYFLAKATQPLTDLYQEALTRAEKAEAENARLKKEVEGK